MDWDFSSSSPIYSQLMAQIRHMIVSGQYSPGERLPAVREMALQAGVSPNTMQRAMNELEREGLLVSQRTAGRYVTEDAARVEALRGELAEQQVKAFYEAMTALGYSQGDAAAFLIKKQEEL